MDQLGWKGKESLSPDRTSVPGAKVSPIVCERGATSNKRTCRTSSRGQCPSDYFEPSGVKHDSIDLVLGSKWVRLEGRRDTHTAGSGQDGVGESRVACGINFG